MVTFSFLIGGCVFAISQAGYLLEIPSQQLVKADVLVALGGDNGGRIYKAAEIYGQHFADHVLLTGIEGGAVDPRSHYLNWRARFLIERDVPEQALLFDTASSNSWEEAVNTLQLMKDRHWQQVLVVSDPPHLRRLAWVWGHVFEGSGKEYRLIAAPLEGWDAGQWWKNDNSVQYVLMEFIKLAYYKIAHTP
jgi:uncharacterized SAM-binding protein YcdF (DUF218 family)